MNIRTASIAAVIATLSLSVANVAFAGPRCTDTDKPQADLMQQSSSLLRKLADSGYRIDEFEVTKGQCYEMDGLDPSGKKVEVYFDPVDGSVVREKRG